MQLFIQQRQLVAAECPAGQGYPMGLIDQRLPDRVTVRLTEEASGTFAESIQQKIKRWGGKA